MKVRVLPCQPHSLAFGGFEIQSISAINAARTAGIDIEPLDVWCRDEDFDILQLWGLEGSHQLAVTWGHRAGKKIVMSVLLPYLSSKTYAKYHLSRLLGFKRIQSKILRMVDRLIVVNDDQAKAAESILNFPIDRISVIPNIVEDIYFVNHDNVITANKFGIEKYLICTGNICKRKSQLILAQAAIAENTPLLIVGRPLTGEDAYADALSKLIESCSKVKWIHGLPPHSQELLDAYRNSVGFALISNDETQPISALEAAAMGKPLLLSDHKWARQSFYHGACLVNPVSLESVKGGIRRILEYPNLFTVPPHELYSCRRQKVSDAYVKLFAQTMLV